MVNTLLHCVCGAEVDTLSDTVRCKDCAKMYHVSCRFNKGYFSKSLTRPHIRILTCSECRATTHIDEAVGSGDGDTLNSKKQNIALNPRGLETCSYSDDPDVSSNIASALHQDVSSIPSELVASSNLDEPSDGENPKKDCGFCGKPVSKKSKILECRACEKSYHYECAAYSPSKIQELFEKNGWICVNCFICEDDLKEEKCRKCEKPILEKSKKLQCHRCNSKYHHECGAYATKELQELLERTRWICKKCFECDEKEDQGSKWKSVGKKAAVGAGLTAACLGGIPLAVGALGFGAAGVTAGSLAAAYQSAFLGGTIASGSAFAVLQSIGAAGLAASTQAGIAAVCTTLPFLSGLNKKKS